MSKTLGPRPRWGQDEIGSLFLVSPDLIIWWDGPAAWQAKEGQDQSGRVQGRHQTFWLQERARGLFLVSEMFMPGLPEPRAWG